MRTIILTRDKKALIKNVDSKNVDHDFRDSLYILESTRVQNYTGKKGELEGTELIFFEDNPNPLTHEESPIDLSETYLDDVVVVNFIQQTTDTFGWKFGWDILSPIKWIIENPVRIPMILMVLAVLGIVIRNLLEGGALI
jgi:hypothetical protein